MLLSAPQSKVSLVARTATQGKVGDRGTVLSASEEVDAAAVIEWDDDDGKGVDKCASATCPAVLASCAAFDSIELNAPHSPPPAFDEEAPAGGGGCTETVTVAAAAAAGASAVEGAAGGRVTTGCCRCSTAKKGTGGACTRGSDSDDRDDSPLSCSGSSISDPSAPIGRWRFCGAALAVAPAPAPPDAPAPSAGGDAADDDNDDGDET